jgi:hypothetical protein
LVSLALMLTAAAATTRADVVGLPGCNNNCTWSVAVDGVAQPVLSGSFSIDPTSGSLSPDPGTFSTVVGAGENQATVGVGRLWGNADPILGFNVSAGTGAVAQTFTFTFNLPIALSGTLYANSSVSYSLTGTTSAGAQVILPPLASNVVTAEEVDTTGGGIGTLNKGVDVGGAFGFLGGPQTQNSPVFTDSGTLTGDLAYDLMRVTVRFELSANSQVGMSGFVQQVPAPVPLPAALPLLLSGLGGIAAFARRRRMAAIPA